MIDYERSLIFSGGEQFVRCVIVTDEVDNERVDE